MGATVEDLGDRAEGLLAGRVPDLQLEDLVLHADQVGAELHPHSHIVIFLELVLN